MGSLALVADSFHMLKFVIFPQHTLRVLPFHNSDVMSLVVALYAIKVCEMNHTPHPNLTLFLDDEQDRSRRSLLLWLASCRNIGCTHQLDLPFGPLPVYFLGSDGTFLLHTGFA